MFYIGLFLLSALTIILINDLFTSKVKPSLNLIITLFLKLIYKHMDSLAIF